MKFDFTLTGKTPILFHADDVEAADELRRWREDPKNQELSVKGDDRSPAWTWTTYLHYDGEHVGMPSDAIMAALTRAAAKIPLPNGRGGETFKKKCQSALMIEEPYCEFLGPKGRVRMLDIHKLKKSDLPFAKHAESVRPLGFSLFVKRARVGQAKHVRVRPRFEEWAAKGCIEILDDTVVKSDVLGQMFDIAGMYCGLLDWAPHSKTSPGPFGKFEAKLSKAK